MKTQPTAKRRTEQPLLAAQVADALLKLRTVQAITGLGKTSIYARMAAGTFPQAIRQGARCTRWRAEAVTSWLRAQTQKGSAA